MTPAERCDEIIKMIDEVLGASVGTDEGPVAALSRSAALDLLLHSTAGEGRA
jgi:hypothetical protein